MRYWLILAVAAAMNFAAGPLFAQQVTTGSPFTRTGHSFFENFGSSWGISAPGSGSFRNFFFNFNGGPAASPFGNPNNGAGARSGLGYARGGLRFGINFHAAQGASSSIQNTTPTMTLTNGYPGFIADSAQSPFVISVIPVVGEGPWGDFGASNTIRGRLLRGEIDLKQIGQSQTADLPLSHPQQAIAPPAAPGPQQPVGQLKIGGGQPAAVDRPQTVVEQVAQAQGADPIPASLAEIERQKAEFQAQQQAEAANYFERGKAAEAERKDNVARLYYKMAIRRAAGELKSQIEARLEELGP